MSAANSDKKKKKGGKLAAKIDPSTTPAPIAASADATTAKTFITEENFAKLGNGMNELIKAVKQQHETIKRQNNDVKVLRDSLYKLTVQVNKDGDVEQDKGKDPATIPVADTSTDSAPPASPPSKKAAKRAAAKAKQAQQARETDKLRQELEELKNKQNTHEYYQDDWLSDDSDDDAAPASPARDVSTGNSTDSLRTDLRRKTVTAEAVKVLDLELNDKLESVPTNAVPVEGGLPATRLNKVEARAKKSKKNSKALVSTFARHFACTKDELLPPSLAQMAKPAVDASMTGGAKATAEVINELEHLATLHDQLMPVATLMHIVATIAAGELTISGTQVVLTEADTSALLNVASDAVQLVLQTMSRRSFMLNEAVSTGATVDNELAKAMQQLGQSDAADPAFVALKSTRVQSLHDVAHLKATFRALNTTSQQQKGNLNNKSPSSSRPTTPRASGNAGKANFGGGANNGGSASTSTTKQFSANANTKKPVFGAAKNAGGASASTRK